jgi:putative acyl-CoA dehydrogenase
MIGATGEPPMTAFAENRLSTHEVENQPCALVDYNLFEADLGLKEGVAREGAGWAADDLSRFGAMAGTADYLELGALANRYPPDFDTHDRYGRRVDLVRFHPAYHELMRVAIAEGIAASPWDRPRPGAHVARAAKFYMQSQVEAGHGCPITMTFAATPTLKHAPALAAEWLPRMHSRLYDPANAPVAGKKGATVGMAMTEKQGGSDVRANTTRAVAQSDGSYEITGHKYFVSAPMCDAFLVLAQTPAGLTCFLAPRWLPDGTKNGIEFVRLKRKMGNVSNASSETEWRGALGWRVGEEGRGVATIIEMVAMTRFDCVIGSAAGMRRAAVEAIDHCRQRSAFGAKLIDQPIMRDVLADLALEAEAALALTLRLARALDEGDGALIRLGAALGKYWVCKRVPQHAYEAMECIGGSGVMEDSPMPRLYREGPVNAIWEGSGNVQCLDVMRALRKSPQSLDAVLAEAAAAKGESAALDAHVEALKTDLVRANDFEARAREFCDRLALGLQASAMWRAAPGAAADAFCRARLESRGAHHYGVLPAGVDAASIVRRAAARD